MLGKVVIAATLVVAASGLGVQRAPGRRAAIAAPVVSRYVAPLPEPLRVLRGFDPPAAPYGPGHLGVDLRAAPAGVVRAAGAGTVRFAGPVAGRDVVVVAHAGGISTEYEPVRPIVDVGASVRAGQPIGAVRGRHPGCAGTCLDWGARRGDTYLDPLDLLRPLGPVVLLPWSDNG